MKYFHAANFTARSALQTQGRRVWGRLASTEMEGTWREVVVAWSDAQSWHSAAVAEEVSFVTVGGRTRIRKVHKLETLPPEPPCLILQIKLWRHCLL